MSNVLVLNADFTPLNVTSLQKSIKLILKGKAEILKEDIEKILTISGEFVRPLIIRLFNYVKFRPKAIKISRHRIYARDNHQCVYCGSKKDLTLDHVLPKSRGGGNEWTNLVTSCFKCNLKKSNRTPDEANMRMKHKPYTPTLVSNNGLQKIWTDYQKSFVY